MKIYQWNDIEGKFAEGIILGNGASIAIDKSFSYSSLLENAQKNKLIKKNVTKVFKHLQTKDFELVLRMLWYTHRINRALGIKDPPSSKAYEEIKTALIESVRKNHVDYDQVSDKLLHMAKFLKQFKTVVSLNYDFLAYWAMLAGNNKWEKQWFKDCFIEGQFIEDWEWLRKGHMGAEGSTLVFYPHGNLVLATDLLGNEHKIVSDEFENLIDTVVDKWESGNYSPLFVSEGVSKQKVRAINRSQYLTSVYKSVFRKLGSRVVIFGWSIGDQDDHILKAICSNKKVKALAVSVVVSKDKDIDAKCMRIEKKIRKTGGYDRFKVVFFDANSEGCWVNF